MRNRDGIYQSTVCYRMILEGSIRGEMHLVPSYMFPNILPQDQHLVDMSENSVSVDESHEDQGKHEEICVESPNMAPILILLFPHNMIQCQWIIIITNTFYQDHQLILINLIISLLLLLHLLQVLLQELPQHLQFFLVLNYLLL